MDGQCGSLTRTTMYVQLQQQTERCMAHRIAVLVVLITIIQPVLCQPALHMSAGPTVIFSPLCHAPR